MRRWRESIVTRPNVPSTHGSAASSVDPASVPKPSGTHASRAACIASAWAPPLLVFLLARLILWSAAASVGKDAFSAENWGAWDTAHYLSIAERGYELFPCETQHGFERHHTCGNAAWMPGFPLLMWAVSSSLGTSNVLAGAVLAAAFALATLVFLWRWFLGPNFSAAGALSLLLAGLFPGGAYAHAIFPISLCALLQIAALRFYLLERFALAGVFGGFAALSYSSGLFVAAAFALSFLLNLRNSSWREMRGTAASVGLTVFGFALVLVWHQFQLGHWNAYFLVQEKYHYQLTAPWTRLMGVMYQALQPNAAATKWQTCFVALLASAFLATAFRDRRSRINQLLGIFLLVCWLLPLMLGKGYLALHRAEATLLLAVPLAKRLPLPALVVCVVTAAVIYYRVGILFFAQRLL